VCVCVCVCVNERVNELVSVVLCVDVCVTDRDIRSNYKREKRWFKMLPKHFATNCYDCTQLNKCTCLRLCIAILALSFHLV